MRPGAGAERFGVWYVADPGVQAVWILDAPRDRYVRVTHVGTLGLVSPVAPALGPGDSAFVAGTGVNINSTVGRLVSSLTPYEH